MEELRWDSWDALASKKWVRRENTGRVDEEDKEVSEKEKVRGSRTCN